jgi:chromosome segregation ATPase
MKLTMILRAAKALLLAGACSLALGQTAAPQAPAKAASAAKAAKAAKTGAAAPAKPASAADDKGKVIGGSKGGPILTRDELRVCFQQEEALRKRLEDIESQRAALDKEKQTIAADQAALREARAPIDDLKRQAEVLSERVKDFGARVESWNKRVAAFNEAGRSGSSADKERNDLNKERDDLGVQQKAIEADKAEFAGRSDTIVKAYNEKAGVLDARVQDWNLRNSQWTEESRGREAERKTWVANCADRRYREDDETAIKAGK